MKLLLVAIVKNENRYLNEWVDYHYNLGFDKIVICDNNDIDGEVIKNKKVIVEDFRGKHESGYVNGVLHSGIQGAAYNYCYKKYSNDYDWIAFFDIDEFLTLRDGLQLKDFLKNTDNISQIYISSKTYGDNNNLVYKKKPVTERFTTPVKQTGYCDNKYDFNPFKSIIKTKQKFIKILCHGSICCGRTINTNYETIPNYYILYTLIPGVYDNMYIKHYETKSTFEFFERHLNKTSATGIELKHNNINNLYNKYFTYNEWTIDKFNIIKKYFYNKLDIVANQHTNLSIVKKLATKLLLYRYLIGKKIIDIYENIIGRNSKK